MWDGGKNGQKGGLPTRDTTSQTEKVRSRCGTGVKTVKKEVSRLGTRPLRLKRSAPDVGRGEKWSKRWPPDSEDSEKCSPESRWHFFALKNARWGPAGIFWHSEMLATDVRAFFGTQKCWRLRCEHFFALRNAGD